MGKKQIGVVVLGLIILFSLYFLAPRKLAKENVNKQEAANAKVNSMSFEEYEELTQKQFLPNLKDSLKVLKAKLSASSAEADKEISARKLADFWNNQQNLPLTAWYSYKIAQANKTKIAFENAANNFLIALNSQKDTLISNNLVTFALASFEEAQKLGEVNVDLSISIARIYTEGTQEPMKGIGLLRGIIQKDSNNIPTLIELGRLAIVSGQYDKAKERLEKVMRLEDSNTEALYFLAVANEGLGNKDLAIKQLEMCKVLVGNPEFDKEINEYIKNLKNK